MRSLLIATMILVIPSFVLFYGWGQINSGNQRALLTAAEVELSSPLASRSVTIEAADLALARQRLASQAAGRMAQSGQIQNFNQLRETQQTLLRGISDKFAARHAAENAALVARAQALGLELPSDKLAQLVRVEFPTQSEADIRAALQRTGRTWEGYLASLRESYLAEQARNIAASNAKASLYELWQEFLLSNEVISVSFVPFSIFTEMRDIQPTQGELLEYFENNREEFDVPARVQVKFVVKRGREFTDEARESVTDDELRAEFEKQVEAGRQAKNEFKVHKIFFDADKRGGEEAAMAAAKALKASLALGQDFATLAAVHSDAPWTAGSSAEMAGTAEPETVSDNDATLADSYKEKVFSLKKGQVSEPFADELGGAKGVFLVKVEEIADPFEGARERLAAQVANAKGRDALDSALLAWSSEAEEHTSVESFAADKGLEVAATEWVDFEADNVGYLKGVGSLRDAAGLVRLLKEDGGVGAFKTGNALVALEVTDFKAGYTPKAVDDDEATTRALANAVKRRLAAEKTREKANEFVALVREKGDFQAAADSLDLKAQNADKFTRRNIQNGNLSGIENFARKTLSTPVGAVSLDDGRKDAKGIPSVLIVWQMREREEPSQEEFSESFASLQSQYLRAKGDGLAEEYVQDLWNSGAIKIEYGQSIQ